MEEVPQLPWSYFRSVIKNQAARSRSLVTGHSWMPDSGRPDLTWSLAPPFFVMTESSSNTVLSKLQCLLVVNKVSESIRRSRRRGEWCCPPGEGQSSQPVPETILLHAVRRAHHHTQNPHQGLAPVAAPGCSVLAGLIDGNVLVCAHLGVCHLFVFREFKLRQITPH